MKLWFLSRLIERGNTRLNPVIGAVWKRHSHFVLPISPDSGNVATTLSESWGFSDGGVRTSALGTQVQIPWLIAEQGSEAGRSTEVQHLSFVHFASRGAGLRSELSSAAWYCTCLIRKV